MSTTDKRIERVQTCSTRVEKLSAELREARAELEEALDAVRRSALGELKGERIWKSASGRPPNAGSLEKRILDFVNGRGGNDTSAETIKASIVGCSAASARTLLARLATDGKIARVKRGVYRANEA